MSRFIFGAALSGPWFSERPSGRTLPAHRALVLCVSGRLSRVSSAARPVVHHGGRPVARVRALCGSLSGRTHWCGAFVWPPTSRRVDTGTEDHAARRDPTDYRHAGSRVERSVRDHEQRAVRRGTSAWRRHCVRPRRRGGQAGRGNRINSARCVAETKRIPFHTRRRNRPRRSDDQRSARDPLGVARAGRRSSPAGTLSEGAGVLCRAGRAVRARHRSRRPPLSLSARGSAGVAGRRR